MGTIPSNGRIKDLYDCFFSKFSYSVILLLIIFLFIRVGYYVFYFMPHLTRDSFALLMPTLDILNGQAPKFKFFTAAYPVFCLLANALAFGSLKMFLIYQSLFSFISIVGGLYVIYKGNPKIYQAFYSAVLIFCLSPYLLHFENHVSPLLLMFSLGYFTVCLIISGSKNYFLIGLLSGILMLVRPQALIFPTGIFLMILLYDYRSLLKYMGGLILILLCQIVYNGFTINSFTLYGQTAKNNLSSSIYFLKKDVSFSKEANMAIDSLNIEIGPIRDRYINTWDFDTLSSIVNSSNYELSERFMATYFKLKGSGYDQISYSGEFNNIAKKAKMGQPAQYLKFVYINFRNGLTLSPLSEIFFFCEIQNIHYYLAESDEMRVNGNERIWHFVTKDYYPYIYSAHGPDRDIFYSDRDLVKSLREENVYGRLLNYYNYLTSKLFHFNLTLPNIIFFLAILLTGSFRGRKELFLTFSIYLSNVVLLCMTVFMSREYLFPLEFFGLFNILYSLYIMIGYLKINYKKGYV